MNFFFWLMNIFLFLKMCCYLCAFYNVKIFSFFSSNVLLILLQNNSNNKQAEKNTSKGNKQRKAIRENYETK